MKTKPRMLAPSECNTEAKVIALNRAVCETPSSWILVDENGVMIANQRYGHIANDSIRLSIADMRKFARWFLRKQRCK